MSWKAIGFLASHQVDQAVGGGMRHANSLPHIPVIANTWPEIPLHCHFIQSFAPLRLYPVTQRVHTTAAVHTLKPRIVHK
jgi:hypothetical protein